jgi:type I restriction enzyme S subunit
MKQAWMHLKLGELCEILDRRGVTPEKLGSQFLNSGFRVVSARNIKGRRLVLDAGEQRFVDEPTYRRWMQSPLRADDVLLTSEAPLGEPAYIDHDLQLCLGQRLFGIRTDKRRLFGRFLFLALQSGDVRKDLLSRATGATAQGIRQSELRHVVIPVPPIPEQQRIVALLDEVFAGLATAKTNAEQNLQNARAIFESHLESVFSQRGEGWVEKRLGDLCQIKTGKKDVNEGSPEGEFPFFTCAAVHTFSDSYSFDTEALLVAGNGNVGQVSYYSGRFEAYQRTYVLFDFKSVTGKYLFRVLDKRLSAAVSRQKLGNTMPYIKMGMLTDFVVPVPPPEEQEFVAKSLSAIADETQRLTRLYERKLAALEELKKSLLHQAFNGEL